MHCHCFIVVVLYWVKRRERTESGSLGSPIFGLLAGSRLHARPFIICNAVQFCYYRWTDFAHQRLYRTETTVSDIVKDKVVVVTGAGAGIGRDFALQFAAGGAKVVVNDLGRNAESGEFAAHRVVAEIKEAGGQAVASTDSVAEWDSAHKIVQAALDTFGRIDCVVNNAGIVRDRMFFNMSLDEWKAVVDVHLNGSFYVARAAAPLFKAQASGSFVNMTSTSGLIGNLGQANYSAAKMGIAGLSKSIALDMAKFNVRSNCIAPWAWTPMTATIPADTPENIARIEKMKKMESAKIAPL